MAFININNFYIFVKSLWHNSNVIRYGYLR